MNGYKAIYQVGEQFERDGKWQVTSTQPSKDLPNGKMSLDELVFARNVKKDGSLGKFQAVFWALDVPNTWHVYQHYSHGKRV